MHSANSEGISPRECSTKYDVREQNIQKFSCVHSYSVHGVYYINIASVWYYYLATPIPPADCNWARAFIRCVRACVRACVCMCVCVSVWCSGLCSRFPIETLRVRSPPSTVSHIFLLLLYLWVVTNSQMCMSEYMWWKKKGKKKKENKRK